ncbi:transglutaminase-like domain-containing protein [Lichenifustis flavocetrariae]|uniref:Transglutaminase domain-containing protein n=1 Tax=Lichenifustis flavocetrariae TaxID=2949735 RepID=A0AA41YY78_9HYPH|nr:transglutaminase domain-containing protein [Lichenifustis flavocetrariae]MCW6509397.1 transglutaminase domain-containing protein [Lichenifustis flavocetrariae]
MLSRRRFTAAIAGCAAATVLTGPGIAAVSGAGEGWRRFRVTTRLDLTDAPGPAQAWVPLATFEATDWVRPETQTWTASEGAKVERLISAGAELLHVQWGAGARFLDVASIVVTRDRTAPFAGSPPSKTTLSDGERATYLSGSTLAPVDGLVKATADRITAGASGDVAKARALYEWVVDNTFRSAPVPGCGDGNVLRMLQTGQMGGKCADINPLFVALARAAGLPARDLYGVRVAPSRLGYASLGPSTTTITKSQHCRAEVFLDGYGWTAMDPADVRKVMLEEAPGGLTMDQPKVQAARARLFGSWEGNWIPFNTANDIALPGSTRSPEAFLMYPQAETAAGRVDCYHPDAVRYTITSEELAI